MIISNSKKFIFFHVPKCAGTTLCAGLAPYSENVKKYPMLRDNIQGIIDSIYTPEHDPLVKKVAESLPDTAMPRYYRKRRGELNWMNLVHYQCEIHPIIGGHENLYPTPVDDPERYGAEAAEKGIVGKYTPFRDHLKDNWKTYKTYHRFAIVRNSWDYVFSIFKNKIVVDDVASVYTDGDDWDKMIEDRLTKHRFLDFVHNIKTDKYTDVVRDFLYHIPYNHSDPDDVRFSGWVKTQQSYYTGPYGFNFADEVINITDLSTRIPQLEKKLGIKLTSEKSLNVSTLKSITMKEFYDQQAIDIVADIFKSDINKFNFTI